MSKKYSFILLTSMVILGACGDTTVADSGTANETPKQEEKASSVQNYIESQESFESYESEELEDDIVVEAEKGEGNGKRSTPFEFDRIVEVEGTASGDVDRFPFAMDVQLSNPIYGQEAYDFLIQQNQFNEQAPDGYEWLIIDIELNLKQGSQDDAYSPLLRLDSVSSNGTTSPDGVYATLESGIDIGYPTMYEGAIESGKLATVVPVDHEGSTIRLNVDFGLDIFYKLP